MINLFPKQITNYNGVNKSESIKLWEKQNSLVRMWLICIHINTLCIHIICICIHTHLNTLYSCTYKVFKSESLQYDVSKWVSRMTWLWSAQNKNESVTSDIPLILPVQSTRREACIMQLHNWVEISDYSTKRYAVKEIC